jgi:hypothetical protein
MRRLLPDSSNHMMIYNIPVTGQDVIGVLCLLGVRSTEVTRQVIVQPIEELECLAERLVCLEARPLAILW